MASYLRLVVFLIGLSLLSGCGYTVKENLAPVSPPSAAQTLPKVVILPFADYTSASLYETWQKNVLIMEALQDEFLKAGFATVPYEDVVQYLIQKEIIKQTRAPATSGTNVLYRELAGDWSPEMKKEIWKAIEQNQETQGVAPQTKPLDRKALVKLGEAFGARYVVRGRIIAFSDSRSAPLNPLKSGLVPFVFQLGSRTIFGVADSQAYEVLNQAATGALMGAGIWWLSADDEAVGAGLGAATGAIYGHPSKSTQARVQLRLLVQDATTGEVVWSNRAEIEVSPESVFALQDQDKLFAKAVNEAARVLVADFASDLATGNLPPVASEAVVPAVEEAKKAAEEARKAALQAQQAAEEAHAAATKTERIFEKTLTK